DTTCRSRNGAIVWRFGCLWPLLRLLISRKATRSRYGSCPTGSSKWVATKARNTLLRVCANSGVLCLQDSSLTEKRPMPVKAFFDTNILIYAVVLDDPRNTQAEELLALGGVLSVQVLNEFVSVARRQILLSWTEVAEALDAFRVLCASPMTHWSLPPQW